MVPSMRRFVECFCLTLLLLVSGSPSVAMVSQQVIVGKASVVEGDTIEVGGQRIRLFGIDTPESSQLCKDAN
jgi:endonuclease YncB( thermonuclease family)